MVIVEQVIRDLLIKTNLCENRVFLDRAPQVPAERMKNPFMVFTHVGPTPYHAHDGPLALRDRVYQVALYDPSQTKVTAIADTLCYYLDGYRGAFEGVLFGGIFYRTEVRAYERDTKLFQVVQEYRIQYHMTDHVQPAVTTRSNNRRQGVSP